MAGTLVCVASVGEVADSVHAALAAAATARAQLLAALACIEPAGELLAQLGAGSTRPDLPTAAAHAQQSTDAIRQAIAMVDQAVNAAEAWLASITGSVAPASDATVEPVARPAVSTPPESTRPSWKLDPATVRRLRAEIPPPITAAERGAGRKTHGRWVGTDGVVRTVVSGIDEWSRYADRVSVRSVGVKFLANRHAEMKVAAQLRANFEDTGQPQHATVVLNFEPCELPKGCTGLLPMMLPEGCSLTVHAPNYLRTFTGGMVL